MDTEKYSRILTNAKNAQKVFLVWLHQHNTGWWCISHHFSHTTVCSFELCHELRHVTSLTAAFWGVRHTPVALSSGVYNTQQHQQRRRQRLRLNTKCIVIVASPKERHTLIDLLENRVHSFSLLCAMRVSFVFQDFFFFSSLLLLYRWIIYSHTYTKTVLRVLVVNCKPAQTTDMFVSFLSALRRAGIYKCVWRGFFLFRFFFLFSYVRSVCYSPCTYSTNSTLSTYILHLSGYLKKTQSTAFYMPPNVSFKISLNSAAFVSCKSPAKIGFNSFCWAHFSMTQFWQKYYTRKREKRRVFHQLFKL